MSRCRSWTGLEVAAVSTADIGWAGHNGKALADTQVGKFSYSEQGKLQGTLFGRYCGDKYSSDWDGDLAMSPQIDVDPDIFEHLQKQAIPLVDTPSTVLRRELGLGNPNQAPRATIPPNTAKPDRSGRKAAKKQEKPRRPRAAAGSLLPEYEYEIPLLRALDDLGGRAPYREVADAVLKVLKDKLLEPDFELLNSGVIRWENRLQFVRLKLIDRDLMERDTPRGIWAITDAGRSALKNSGQSPAEY